MTTKHVVADDVLGTITRRLWEVLRRVMEGTLNPDAVATALQKIAEGTLPTEMTIAGRTYEIVDFLQKEDKGSVVGHTMVERAKELNANLGEDDAQYLLDHQEEIPEALRGKVVFVFPGWRGPDDPGCVAYVYWRGDRWVRYWRWLDGDFYGYYRLLRRK
ncbi:hypothetical protein C4569_02020 [Candidatus Parcubacteria bacterium]|nr:MAG: hypothetical protein C4569_02020 [Candidatus Parcubacteria bacterium]